MTRLALYASGIAVVTALWFGAVEAHPLAFAFCGMTFAVSAGIVLFKE